MSQVQVGKEHYFGKKYHEISRFIAYYTQIELIGEAKADSILFVGVGDGVVPQALAGAPVTLTTFDFDPELHPDVVGDVRTLPFADGSFDASCIFEVLEHLPWDEMRGALGELARVSRKRVIVSIPHRRTGFELVLKFPYIRSIFDRDYLRLALLFPVRFPGFAVSKQHYWEIDGRTTTLAAFRAALREHYSILHERTAVLDPYRRYFVLEPLPRQQPAS